MAARSYRITMPIFRCSSSNTSNNENPNKQMLNKIKISGIPMSTRPLKESPGAAAMTSSSVAPVVPQTKEKTRQNIPNTKQFIDPHRQGLIIEGGVGYRQTVVIRSYEVGPDKTVTLESILNLLQETALNHVWLSGLLSNGFGATHGMVKNNLIWVVSKLQLQIDQYPIWGEVVEIDTWVGASGKNGMRRDWLIRSQATGHVFARATSVWVMMNEMTRRLSKMPEEVREEIGPWFIQKQAIKEDVAEKIPKLDNKARFVISNLKPKRSDLDMNHHVNNVKYVRWMLEAIPDQFVECHQLSGITLEYRRECGSADIVQSLCDPDDDGFLNSGPEQNVKKDMNLLNRFSLASEIMEGNGMLGLLDKPPSKYTHLLLAKGQSLNEEIVRGRTIWKKRMHHVPFST